MSPSGERWFGAMTQQIEVCNPRPMGQNLAYGSCSFREASSNMFGLLGLSSSRLQAPADAMYIQNLINKEHRRRT